MSTNDGGSAFPSPPVLDANGGFWRPADIGCEGMTLRDYFAAKAMQGLLSNPNVKPEVNAARFYSWADAMIAERAKVTA